MRRRRSSREAGKFFVGDDRSAPSAGAALSIAQNLAVNAPAPRSFYVRDVLGNTVYRVDRLEDGVVVTHTIDQGRAAA